MIKKEKLNPKVTAVATVLRKRNIFPGPFILQVDRVKRDVFVEHNEFKMRFPDTTFMRWTITSLVSSISRGYQEYVAAKGLKPALPKVGLVPEVSELVLKGGDSSSGEEGSSTESPVSGSGHGSEVVPGEFVEGVKPRTSRKVKKAGNTASGKVKKGRAPKE